MLSKKIFYVIVLVVILISFIPSFYFYNRYYKTQQMLKDPSLIAKEEIASLLEKIGKLMELPKDETPTLATISDKTKLEKNAFYKNAENGDKILIYTQAKKAILYRPSINKIIDVAPVTIGNLEAKPSSSSSAVVNEKKIKFALYNGTAKVGITDKAEEKILEKIKNYELVAQLKADSVYSETMVSDLSGENNKIAEEVALILKGKVVSKSQVENQEEYKDADILVIVGSDFTE